MTLWSPDSRAAHIEPPLSEAAVWQRRASEPTSPQLMVYLTAVYGEDTSVNIIKSSSTLA